MTAELLIHEHGPQLKESKEHEKTIEARLTLVPSTQEKAVKVDRQTRTSASFVMNLFRDQFYPNVIFHDPNVLNE